MAGLGREGWSDLGFRKIALTSSVEDGMEVAPVRSREACWEASWGVQVTSNDVGDQPTFTECLLRARCCSKC